MSRKTVKIEKKYLVFPVGDHSSAETKKVRLLSGEELVFDFDAPISYSAPVFQISVDVSGFIGKELTVEIDMPEPYTVEQTDIRPPECTERSTHRPRLHYTPRFGWINDPNGLFRYTSRETGQTMWHMFYQHNPFDTQWGNMHWGHCVSSDLIHWQEKNIVLKPDRMGTMYSGSAVVDHNNVSGLQTGDEAPILLFYTAAGSRNQLSAGRPFTQCLAYSTDGGRTFQKYEHNPIVDHIEAYNRDPKVVFCSELDCWIMALYLQADVFCLLRSTNLLHWTEFQRLTLPGDAECPDLFSMETAGENKETVWVLRGASHFYAVLKVNTGTFEVIQASQKHFYGHSFAAQTFFDTDDPRITIAWEPKLSIPDKAYSSQMSIPYALTLKKEDGKYILCTNPIKKLDALDGTISEYADIMLPQGKNAVFPTENGAYDVMLYLGGMRGNLKLQWFGNSIELNFGSGEIICGEERFPILYQGIESLRMLVDTCSCTFISGDGRLCAEGSFVCDSSPELSVSSDTDNVLKRLTLKKLKL